MIERKLKKIWVTQASVNIAGNREVLRWAYRSGCRGLYIGIESVLPDSLKEMKKGVNLRWGIEGVKRAVRQIHDHGICVIGAFILGNDHDDEAVFQRTLDFMHEAGIDVPQIGILTPFPGTRLWERLSMEKRIVYNSYPDDWEKCDTDHLVFKPKILDPVDLIRGFDYIARKKFSKKAVFLQALRTWAVTRSPVAALLGYNLNKDSHLFYNYDVKFAACSRSPR